ncbi:MAG: TIGR00730 family Rossman fold protein [Pseudomonadota bacterium]|nr:TIGR00730 family Rossman fold protein [Pseudomonadota bacterium]
MSDQPGSLPVRTFPTALEDAVQEVVGPDTRYEGPESAYRLAFTDTDFLLREELRPVRLQLELLKPQMVQDELGVEATIVIFGSARILPPDDAAAALAAARADPASDATALRIAEQRVAMARYYEEARRFAAIVTRRSASLAQPIYVVTGGGPGIMEAGNRGAYEVGGKSVGLNITLSREQTPNPYITPELCFQFHYFALRKMHFLMRAVALVCFPGGFGTLDELFEVLTLVQTGKSKMRPIILFGRDFWSRLIDFELLVETGMINAEDLGLFHFVETAEEAWSWLADEYGLGRVGAESAGSTAPAK